jgi:5-hydroxyisourate hydrolase
MGKLSTHVLDTVHGCPAAGMAVSLHRVDASGHTLVRELTLNADGRSDGPLLDSQTMASGRWRLSFAVADYFRSRGMTLPEPPFLDVVHIDFGIADVQGNYHVPLLCSPWSHATYRGS